MKNSCKRINTVGKHIPEELILDECFKESIKRKDKKKLSSVEKNKIGETWGYWMSVCRTARPKNINCYPNISNTDYNTKR